MVRERGGGRTSDKGNSNAWEFLGKKRVGGGRAVELGGGDILPKRSGGHGRYRHIRRRKANISEPVQGKAKEKKGRGPEEPPQT